MKSRTILFFGNEQLATGTTSQLAIFKYLLSSDYQIKALIVSPGDIRSEPAIVQLARKSSIDIKTYDKLLDAAKDIASYNVDYAVLAAYGKIIPKVILDLFRGGIINVHPSLLPKHRGPTPIESTILNGDLRTGVSIMKLGIEMDAGPVYAQERISLSGSETKQQLASQLDNLGAKLLSKNLEAITDGSLTPKDQSVSGVTYDKLISKEDGIIDWSLPAITIERQIRAFSSWPKARTKLSNLDLTILECHVIDGNGNPGQLYLENNQIGVYTGDGIIVFDKVLPSGKKEMSAQSFLVGYRQKLS